MHGGGEGRGQQEAEDTAMTEYRIRGEDGDRAWSARQSHRVVLLDDGTKLLIGGFGNAGTACDVWASSDENAQVWRMVRKTAEFDGRDGHGCAATMSGAVLVVSGASGSEAMTHQVWLSEDKGKSWTLRTAAPGWCGRTHAELIAFTEENESRTRLLLCGGLSEGGYLNDAWRSVDDGLTWDRVTASAQWSPRAMHAACGRGSAAYLCGGTGPRGDCMNDVWASTDGGRWIRLCERAPWLPRRGHTLVASSKVFILAGGETADEFSLGDCWTSKDGASWNTVRFDLPPTHLHAALPMPDGMLILGGSTSSGKKTKSVARDTIIRLRLSSHTYDQASSNQNTHQDSIEVSMASVVSAVSELRQLRAAIREVQRGNVQLADSVKSATKWQDAQQQQKKKEHDDKSIDDTESKQLTLPANNSLTSLATSSPSRPNGNPSSSPYFFSRLNKAWAATGSQQMMPRLNSLLGPPAVPTEEDDNTSEQSSTNFFDARSIDSTLSPQPTRTASGRRSPLVKANLNIEEEEDDEQNEKEEKEEVVCHIPECAVKMAEEALKLDTELSETWENDLWPAYREVRMAALARVDRSKLNAAVVKRDYLLRTALVRAQEIQQSLERMAAASDELAHGATSTLSQISARLSLEVDGVDSGLKRSTSSNINALALIASKNVFTNDSLSIETEAEPKIWWGTALTSWLADEMDDITVSNESFEAVARELKTHCAKPELASSARRATDAALSNLGDALRVRADAADALRANIHYVATDTAHEDEPTRLEEEVARRTLAAARIWDDAVDDRRARLEAHSAVGRELSVIPGELDDALRLKTRLLKAGHARCAESEHNARQLSRLCTALSMRAKVWTEHFSSSKGAGKITRRLCEKAEDTRETLLSLEDARVDLASAIEKLRRRKQRLEPPAALANEIMPTPAPAVNQGDGVSTALSLATGAVVLPTGSGQMTSLGVGVLGELFLCRRTQSVEYLADEALAAARKSALPEDEAGLVRKAQVVDARLATGRRDLRRAVAMAARGAFAIAPEVAYDSTVLLDTLGRLNLLGLDHAVFQDDYKGNQQQESFWNQTLGKSSRFSPFASSSQTKPHRHSSEHWFRNPSRELEDFDEFEKEPNATFYRAVDKLTGEAALLKAYALDEKNDDDWTQHEAEIDALLALPRHEALAAPRAIVTANWAPVPRLDGKALRAIRSKFAKDGSAEAKTYNFVSSPMLYLEFQFHDTDGVGWAKEASREPWHVQAVARQILTALIVLHSREVVHAHLTPCCVLLSHRDTKALLATRHLLRGGTIGKEDTLDDFVAPEILSGETGPTTASDMYSFGATLRWLHTEGTAVRDTSDTQQRRRRSASGSQQPDEDLRHLLAALTANDPNVRPSAADAMLHSYFQNSYMDRFIAGGDVVAQNEKLEAVRDLLRRVKSEMRGLPGRRELTVKRETLVQDVLTHFSESNVRRLTFEQIRAANNSNSSSMNHITRKPLRVTFEDEAGVDEGGLTAEMFALFFRGVLDHNGELFESSGGDVLLPRPVPSTEKEGSMTRADFLAKMHAFGRVLVTACYEGCGAPSSLAPSIFKYLARGSRHVAAGDARALRDLQKFDPSLGASLENMLASAPPDGSFDWGLDFNDVTGTEEYRDHDDDDQPALPKSPVVSRKKGRPRPVTEANKHQFVVLKVRWILTGCRVESLNALGQGFHSALSELSPEASPLLKLLSSTDWRLLLTADDNLTPEHVLDTLDFVGFPKKSIIPDALKRTLESFSNTDSLRRFLVFTTGSPALPNDGRDLHIQVRCQPLSDALPVAHTCFFHLDIPDYEDEGTFITKFTMALHECSSFDRV